MGKPNITPEKRKKMPPRGRGKFSVLLEVIKEASMIGLTPKSTQEDAQKAFLLHLAQRALNPEDMVSGQLLNSLVNRCFPPIKSVMPEYDVGIDDNDSIDDIAEKILRAAGGGCIPPDAAAILMGVLKDKAIINEKGELMRRIEELEDRIKNGGSTPKAD